MLGLSGCVTEPPMLLTDAQRESIKVVTPGQIAFVPLNPARGDAAPQAGMLWGNLREDVPTGMLITFADGFSSPPHIHNITYRGVVIRGALHNDDPDAATMWMSPGAYWMQPAGEVHVTAAEPGAPAMAFLEILEGPYLVQPGSEAFDNGERPVNVEQSNLVWLDADDMEWIEYETAENHSGPEVALLWGDLTEGRPSGSMIKLPTGVTVSLSGRGAPLDAVMIAGQLDHMVSDVTETAILASGAYFASDPEVEHKVTCQTDDPCLVYVRTNGSFVLK